MSTTTASTCPRTSRRLTQRWPACCLLAAMPALAHAQDTAGQAAWQQQLPNPPLDISVRSGPALAWEGAAASIASPRAAGLYNDGLSNSPGNGLVSQRMVWVQRQRWSAGLGVAQRLNDMPGAIAPPAEAQAPVGPQAALLVGVGVGLGQASATQPQLTWQTPLASQDALGLSSPRQMRVGLTFTLRDPYADLRRGALMKLELSGQTALSLRPRGGRMGLLLTSRW